MPRPTPRCFAIAAVCAFVLATVSPVKARAAEAAAFMEAVSVALAPADVRRGSTIPVGPLLSDNNELDELVARTPEIIHRACQMIATARREVLLQVYEWDDADESAHKVLAALKARAERALSGRGEPLRIGVVTNFTWLAENKLQQTELKRFIDELRARQVGGSRVRAEWATHRGSLFDILHSKSLVIDGERALVMTNNLHTDGGMDRDSFNMGAVVRGPVAYALREDWRGARAMAIRESSTLHAPIYDAGDVRERAGDGYLGAAVLSRRSNWTYWNGGNANPQARGVVALFDTATEMIDLINPYLGVKEVQAAIVRGIVERGIHVRVILSLNINRWREKHFFGGDNVDHAYALYAELLELGGTSLADHLTIVWGAQNGVDASQAASPGNVHAKVASFDGQCFLIGSTNLNWLSWNNGRELSIALFGLNVASEFTTSTFAELLSRAAPLSVGDLSEERRGETDPVATYLRLRAGTAM